ncbi:MAG TPA: hypothetical protein VGH53_31050 [Streptosporangiaceae bacterium]
MVMWASGGRADVAGLAVADPGSADAEPAGALFAGELLADSVPAGAVLTDALPVEPARANPPPVTALPQPAISPARTTPTAAERQVSRIVRG